MLQNDTKGEICMQRPNRPPALVPAAARLLYICLTLNCLYLLGVALYAAAALLSTAGLAWISKRRGQ